MAKLAPKMLQSYMAKAKEDADLPDYDEEEVDVDAEDGEDYIEEASEEMAEEMHGGDYEDFMQSFFEHASDIQSAADSIVLSVLDEELDDAVKADLTDALDAMPPELVAGIKAHFSKLSLDELHDVVESLEESGAIENDASVVPFLYWAARAG